MGNRVPMEPSARRAWVAMFVGVFIMVFVLVVVTTTIITFILPEAYASTARIQIERISAGKSAPEKSVTGPNAPGAAMDTQTDAEIIQSEIILNEVIDRLDLNRKWAKKYASPMPFKNAESRGLLKRMVEIRRSPSPAVLNIRAYSDDKQEAAAIANTVAETYRDYRQRQGEALSTNSTGEFAKLKAELKQEFAEGTNDPAVNARINETIARAAQLYAASEGMQIEQVEIIDRATPSYRPFRPNKPLNIAMGIIIGGFAGSIVAGAVVALGIFLRKPRTKA